MTWGQAFRRAVRDVAGVLLFIGTPIVLLGGPVALGAWLVGLAGAAVGLLLGVIALVALAHKATYEGWL